MKNKLALFDLDGTLFNTNDVNYYSYKEALNDLGYDLDYNYFCNECNGKHYKVFLPNIIGDNKSLFEIVHNKKKTYYSKYLSKAKVNDNLINIAFNIKSKYYLVVVTTASKKNTLDILNYFNLFELFDLIITHEDVSKVKPDPEGFLKAINYYSLQPTDTVIFEDSDLGIDAARKTGATVFKVDKF